MKVTNGELTTAKEALGKLMEVKFPVKTAYALGKLANKIATELRTVEETRDGLIRKYGTEKDGKLSVTAEDATWNDFVAEYNTLMDIQTEVALEVVELPECEVEPIVLAPLEKFVKV